MHFTFRSLLITFFILWMQRAPSLAVPMGTAFSYQGRLNDSGAAAEGLYDLKVQLHSADTGGSPLASASLPGVLVTKGVFTVQLDFGAAVFDGSARWLEIGVRKQGEGDAWNVLSPRQEISPAPYALLAKKVPDGSISSVSLAPGAVGASQLAQGSVSPDKLAPGAAAANLAASGQSGVARGGVVLSPSPNSADLQAAGYFQTGKVDLIPEKWTRYADAPDAPSPVSANAKAVWTGSLLLAWGGGTNTGGKYNPVTNVWTALSTAGAPATRSGHCAVWTGTEMIVWGGTDGTTPLNSGARYNPATNTWTAMTTINAPSARVNAPAVWTGTEMIVWGGGEEEKMSTGARYIPSTNSWVPMTNSGAPAARYGHSLVWTGTRLLVWGGIGPTTLPNQEVLDYAQPNGASFNPATNSWTPMASGPACAGHAAVWTGNSMIINGGYNLLYGQSSLIFVKVGVSNCAKYNPGTNSWTPLTADWEDKERFGHTAVWTGTDMIVWGGHYLQYEYDIFGNVWTNSALPTKGIRYNPVTETWTPMSENGAPPGREDFCAAWTGSQLFVFGGGQSLCGRYDAAGNSWIPMVNISERSTRTKSTIVWTGAEALIFGGVDDTGTTLQNGQRFNPQSNSWVPMSPIGAPSARRGHSAIWTGSRMIIWGGRNDTTYFNDGAAYNPLTDKWSPLGATRPPSGREQHEAVWTGTDMLIWGGVKGGVMQQTGARYDPVTDAWYGMRSTGAPAGRLGFAFVWTGSEAVLWGGEFRGTPLTTGGRYNVATDSWAAISTTGAPPGRAFPTGVWTGREVLFCGGGNATDGYPTAHGSYSPATDSWTALPSIAGMGGRAGHCAAWNGSQLIVWGGANESGNVMYAATYSPELAKWTGVNSSLPNVPSPRTGALSIWAGSAMLIFGGTTQTGMQKDVYGYTPAATFYLYQRP